MLRSLDMYGGQTEAGGAGFSLVELVVAIAIGSALALISASLILRQREFLHKLSLRSDLTDLTVEIQSAILRPEVCIANFPSPFKIDESKIGTADYSEELTTALRTQPAGVPTFERNQAPKGIPYLRVAKVEARRILKIADNYYRFDVEVEVKDLAGNRFAIVKLPRIRMNSDPAAALNNKTAVTCNASERAPVRTCRTIQNDSPDGAPISTLCDASEELASGGAVCLTATGAEWVAGSVPDSEFGYIYYSQPVIQDGRAGWAADCSNTVANNGVRTRVYAVCCL